jgi:hypothetical protein
MREGTLLFLGESLMPEALVYIVFFSVSLVTTTFLPPTFSVAAERIGASDPLQNNFGSW